ncbi:MAG: hypothetical protein NUW22_04975 [Acidobacteria bacterium]|nr:hypothetical protein [Acidobacteriota bacterium]
MMSEQTQDSTKPKRLKAIPTREVLGIITATWKEMVGYRGDYERGWRDALRLVREEVEKSADGGVK